MEMGRDAGGGKMENCIGSKREFFLKKKKIRYARDKKLR
jgi:hypothetical protein